MFHNQSIHEESDESFSDESQSGGESRKPSRLILALVISWLGDVEVAIAVFGFLGSS